VGEEIALVFAGIAAEMGERLLGVVANEGRQALPLQVGSDRLAVRPRLMEK